MKEISKDGLKKYDDYLTVGKLKDFLNRYNLPDDANVVIQRVEDVYYEKHGWGVYLKKSENTFYDKNGNVVKESLEQYHPTPQPKSEKVYEKCKNNYRCDGCDAYLDHLK